MANWVSIVMKVRAVLTKLTDLLLIGREQGWWNRKGGPPA